jgi:lysophospholipase L1-like esterase
MASFIETGTLAGPMADAKPLPAGANPNLIPNLTAARWNEIRQALIDTRGALFNGALSGITAENMYPDTATALAAVAEGAYFTVPSFTETESLILYRKVSAAAAEVSRYPSALIVAAAESARAAAESARDGAVAAETAAEGYATTAGGVANRVTDLETHTSGWVNVKRPAEPTGGRDAFLAAMRTLSLAGGKKVTWIGDSITEQGKPGQGSGAGLGIGFTTYIEQAFPGITYSNQGIGGETTLDVIARLATITATAADLYVLAIGINDARYNDVRGATSQAAYIANVATIVAALEAAGGDVVVLSIWPSFWEDQFAALGRKATDDRFKQWNAALERYCAETDVPFVDAYTPITRAVNLGNVTTLIPDGVHPDYAGTAGKRLYSAAVLRGAVSAAEFAAEYAPSGSVFYKLVIFDHGASTDRVSIQNINPQPSVSEFFAYSANAAVDVTGLLGAYSAGAGGFLNKNGDWPAVLTFSAPSFLTSAVTAWRAGGLGIKGFELYVSTDPKALTDPTHPSWVLKEAEYSNVAFAHNLLPAKREGVFYRLQFDDSAGTDGTGGTTGQYVKVTQAWGGSSPVRWSHLNAQEVDNLRTDLIFSAAGGSDSAGGKINNAVANTYPLHLAWEAEGVLSTLTIASVAGGGAASRAIKNWRLFESRDPAALADVAHASWYQVAAGVGDQTIDVRSGGRATLAVNSTTPSVSGGRNFITANTAPTTITSLTGGVEGQTITIVVNDANTTFNFVGGAGNLKGNGGFSWAAPQYSVLTATYSAAVARWFCVIGSPGPVSSQVVSGSVSTAQSAANATNGGTVTPSAPIANAFVYTAGAGVASFTVAAPLSPVTGQRISVRIKNASGGATAVTWNAAFKMATWTNPATGQSRSIDFVYDGTNWVEVGRTPADVPN